MSSRNNCRDVSERCLRKYRRNGIANGVAKAGCFARKMAIRSIMRTIRCGEVSILRSVGKRAERRPANRASFSAGENGYDRDGDWPSDLRFALRYWAGAPASDISRDKVRNLSTTGAYILADPGVKENEQFVILVKVPELYADDDMSLLWVSCRAIRVEPAGADEFGVGIAAVVDEYVMPSRRLPERGEQGKISSSWQRDVNGGRGAAPRPIGAEIPMQRRALIVDDEPSLGELFREATGTTGMQILALARMRRRSRHLAKEKFDVVLLGCACQRSTGSI